ncbi:uncharacterized protein LOC111368371 [Olea europaea var. sylvestris]|uniref:uncharacterized protein LOC111368371 n=1 Tax=Olea europaea var. sylvestris TaxID=158386 RepID=UPI000C1CF02F|nr:uncharacterized protein LOC111368371 [Olea europaea var. sylvestris]
MATNISDSFGVRFTEKNYSAWEFQFRLFVMGKELWGHIDGCDPIPTEVAKLAQWTVKDARLMTWISGSVDPMIVLNPRPYKTTKDMWKYLKKGNLNIQDYFSGFQNLWGEFTDIIYAKVPLESLAAV